MESEYENQISCIADYSRSIHKFNNIDPTIIIVGLGYNSYITAYLESQETPWFCKGVQYITAEDNILRL